MYISSYSPLTFQSPDRQNGQAREIKMQSMLFMLERAPPLITESETIRHDYESVKALFRPDQRRIIEFRHNFLDLILRIYELILSIMTLSKCGNVVKIEANIRHLLYLNSVSGDIFDVWKRTSRHAIRVVFKSLYYLAHLPMATDDERKLIKELVQWAKAENSKWDIQMTEEDLAHL